MPAMRACEKRVQKRPIVERPFTFLAFLPQLNLKKPLVIFLPNSSTSFHVESDWSGGS